MKRTLFPFRGRPAAAISAVAIIGSICLCSAPVSGLATTYAATSGIHVSASQIPVAKTMEVFKLHNQAAPTRFLNQIAMRMNPDSKGIQPLSRLPLFQRNKIKPPSVLWGAQVGAGLGLYENKKTGDAQVFPQLSSQGIVTGDKIGAFTKEATVEARRMVEAYQLMAKDPTMVTFEPAQPLDVSNATPTGANSTTGAALAYVPIARSVGDFHVYGRGSRALLAFDPQMTVQSFVRSWKTASRFRSVHETRSRKQVDKAIVSQLRGARVTGATVNDVQIAYYDGGLKYLQPVYRFTATVSFTKKQDVAAPDVVVGYVHIGKQFEPLPSLARQGKPPKHDSKLPTTAIRLAPRRSALGDPCVGRYVVRDDDPGWVNDANLFWSGLSTFWGSSNFSNCQYYWGEPFQYESLKDARANHMNITLTEGHGDWWEFTTEKNCCDVVNINGAIPSPGFGASANGNLDYWIIHSCEVVPSPDDTSSWANPWWNVFGGLHTVLGYRTIMYINDSVGGPFGTSLVFFAPVISAWLNAVMSAPDYSGGPVWNGPEGAHGIGKLMGRPSAITVTGHQNDIAYDTSNAGRAGSLTIYWFPG